MKLNLTPRQRRRIIYILVVLIMAFVLPRLLPDEEPSTTNTPPPVYTLPTTSAPASSPQASSPEQIDIDGDNYTIVFSYEDVPEFSGDLYVYINDNVPYFTSEQIQTTSFEYYAPLDDLGRCTETVACIGNDLMPTDKRGSISSVKPTGWKNNTYDFVDGRYVYNRCHLIGYQLTAENANPCNLITGTRSLNIVGMLPFENQTASYIHDTGQHVMYRVTPIFVDDELVCRGVLMEGLSVEDDGEGVEFCVFCYNIEPGVVIDYATGENWEDKAA